MQRKNKSKCIILNVHTNDIENSFHDRYLSPARKTHGSWQDILIKKKKKKLQDEILSTEFSLKHKLPRNFDKLLTYLCYDQKLSSNSGLP